MIIYFKTGDLDATDESNRQQIVGINVDARTIADDEELIYRGDVPDLSVGDVIELMEEFG